MQHIMHSNVGRFVFRKPCLKEVSSYNDKVSSYDKVLLYNDKVSSYNDKVSSYNETSHHMAVMAFHKDVLKHMT